MGLKVLRKKHKKTEVTVFWMPTYVGYFCYGPYEQTTVQSFLVGLVEARLIVGTLHSDSERIQGF